MGLYDERQKVDVILFKALETDELFGLGMNEEYKDISFGLYASADLTAADGSVIPAGSFPKIRTLWWKSVPRYTAIMPAWSPLSLIHILTSYSQCY